MKANLQAMLRDLGEVHNWAKRASSEILKSGSNPERAIMATLDDMRRMLNPAISVESGNHRMLANARNKFNNLSDDGRSVLIPEQIRALTDPGLLSMIRGVFRDGGGFFVDGSGSTALERAALDLLMDAGHRISLSREPLSLTGADTVEIADSLGIVKYGLDKRYDLMIDRGAELAIALGGSVDKNVLLGMDDATKIRIYEKFYSGRWVELPDEIPALESGMEEYKIPSVDRSRVILEMIVRMRANEVLAGWSEQLARRGLLQTYETITADIPIGGAFRDGYIDNVVHFLNQEAAGWKSILVDEDGRWLTEGSIKYPPGKSTYESRGLGHGASSAHAKKAYIDAKEIMRRFGFKSFKGEWVRFTFPDGSDAVLPAMVAKSIEETLETVADIGRSYGSARVSTYSGRLDRLRRAGAKSGLTPEQEARIGVQTRTLKQTMPTSMADATVALLRMVPGFGVALNVGLTVGPLIVTPAYFMGNLLGAQFQVFAKTGLRGLLSANFAEPVMTMAVTKRLWGAGRAAPGDAIIVTKDGRVYTADMLALEAQRRGLDSSFIQAETIESLAAELSRTHASAVEKLSTAPRGLVNIYTEAATASDNYFRVGTFISEIKNGASLNDAAATARSALYDYGALTKFEKTVLRNSILFYSFQRKNMDLFFDTLMTNPHRLAGQIRLANWLQEELLEEESEIVLPEYYRARLVTAFREATVNHATDAGVATMPPPLPIADVLYIMADLADLTSAGVAMAAGERLPGQRVEYESALGGLVSKTHPYLQALYVLPTGRDVYYQRDLDSSFNTVPPWFVELDQNLLGGFLTDLAGIEPDFLGPEKAHMWQTSTTPYAWRARNGRVWWMIRNAHMVPGMGRSMDTITQLDRANTTVVETVVQQSRLVRKVYADYGIVEPREEGLAHPYSALEEDTMSPRWGLTEGEELLQLMGLKKVIVPTKEAAYDRMAREALRKAQAAEYRERRESSIED